IGSQSAVYFIRLNGATGAHSAPALLDNEAVGHQLFPDISADGGVLHATWWDSRLDANYSPQRPVGNDADGVTGPALDVLATRSTNGGASWAAASTRTSTATERHSDRRERERAGGFSGHRPLALQHLGQPDGLRLIVDAKVILVAEPCYFGVQPAGVATLNTRVSWVERA